MNRKVYILLYFLITFLAGALFIYLHIPAGWLLGSLISGILFNFLLKELELPNSLFKIALAIIGTNIGFMMTPDLFQYLAVYFIPLAITLILTVICGILMALLLRKYSSLDAKTAFFCCLPGGASEVIALSKEYGADERIVAAFHSARIMLIVLTIPFFVGIFHQGTSMITTIEPNNITVPFTTWGVFLFVLIVAVFLSKKIKVPGGGLLIAIVLGFILSTLLLEVTIMPSFVTGGSQAFIGALIASKFDRASLRQLKNIGGISVKILFLYFIMCLGTAVLFYLLTPLQLSTSILGTVPGGAPEMSSTAIALNIEPTLVASLQMIRVILLYILLPFLVKWFIIDKRFMKYKDAG